MSDLSPRFVQVLTIWRERPTGGGRQAVWRFRLEDVHTGERHGFADLQALVAYLQAWLANVGPKSSDDASRPHKED